jgi:hypothetical protein
MRNAERKKEDRVLNSEFGMRNAERKKKTDDGGQKLSISDFGFGIVSAWRIGHSV